MDLPLAFAALTLALWLGAAWDVLRGNRRLRRLATLDTPPPAAWPRVSIVFAARNEAATVGAAVPTMLALDYPDLEFIAVNDRSDDATGEILDALAARDLRLLVEHIPSLRPGWLGKNHALHRGAQRATGRWILFTDADVHFRSDALRRAIAHAEAAQLDHLAVVPQLHERGHLLGIGVAAFSLLFALFLRPWTIPDPRSPSHGGAGAVSVAWYASVGELVRGLTKNAYAGVDYRAWMILGGVAAHGLFFFWPLAALAAATGAAWWLNAAAVLVMLAVAVENTRADGGRAWHGLFLPVGLLIMDYILVRSMLVTHAQRGIVWRGTHYPLRELKENRL